LNRSTPRFKLSTARRPAWRWSSAHITIERSDTTLQRIVDLTQPVGAVELIGRDTKSAEQTDQQEGQP
jgi:hypothetical protein